MTFISHLHICRLFHLSNNSVCFTLKDKKERKKIKIRVITRASFPKTAAARVPCKLMGQIIQSRQYKVYNFYSFFCSNIATLSPVYTRIDVWDWFLLLDRLYPYFFRIKNATLSKKHLLYQNLLGSKWVSISQVWGKRCTQQKSPGGGYWKTGCIWPAVAVFWWGWVNLRDPTAHHCR